MSPGNSLPCSVPSKGFELIACHYADIIWSKADRPYLRHSPVGMCQAGHGLGAHLTWTRPFTRHYTRYTPLDKGLVLQKLWILQCGK